MPHGGKGQQGGYTLGSRTGEYRGGYRPRHTTPRTPSERLTIRDAAYRAALGLDTDGPLPGRLGVCHHSRPDTSEAL